jgi:hypothetical protein
MLLLARLVVLWLEQAWILPLVIINCTFICRCLHLLDWDGIVSIVTRLQGVKSWQEQGMIFFSKNVKTGSGTHPAAYSVGVGVLSQVVKWPGHEVIHVPPSSIMVKNGWIYTFTSPVYNTLKWVSNVCFHCSWKPN